MMKKRQNSGFTLAEMLIVVAIIIILMGVAFVAVQNHQRSMTRLEFDGIAKEIFFAAQNHLTTVQSQGYLEENTISSFGHPGTKTSEDPDDVKNEEIFYLVSGERGTYPVEELILPAYAVDGTALAGSYIIRYQPSTARVLDVFYSLDRKSNMLTVSGTKLEAGDYTALMGESPNYRDGADGPSNREKYKNRVVGWYGGETAIETGARLRAPIFEVINEHTLHVKLSDPNTAPATGYARKLIVIGKTSGAEKYFDLVNVTEESNEGRVSLSDGVYDIVLDDITRSGMHFADIKCNKVGNTSNFIPGEDLIIKAVAYRTDARANIAMSAEKITNSLFAEPLSYVADETVKGTDIEKNVVGIDNFRHLENLDQAISKLGANSDDTVQVEVKTAGQMKNLDWTSFSGNIAPITGSVNSGSYWPVTPSYHIQNDSAGVKEKLFSLTYLGQGHSVSNIKTVITDENVSSLLNYTDSTKRTADAGLFGTLATDSSVTNLELIDFDITGTTSAGALVGTANGTEITNVVAHNSETKDSTFNNSGDSAKPNVTATGAAGSAGGLIGSMSGGSVTKSAAAVYVASSGNKEEERYPSAGGLIGSAASGTVTACYSGGHTYSGAPAYDSAADRPDPRNSKNTYPVRYYDADNKPMYNVTATGGTAGGLIGSAGAATISNSYSTCSASGTTAGGFVGSGGAISNCYCTGLVKGTSAEGAFAALDTRLDPNKPSYYFEIINERSNTDSSGKPAGYDYLKPLGNVEADATTGVTALDANVSTYDTFSGGPTNWKEAEAYPYDAGGTDSYGLKVLYRVDGKTCYNFPTVEKLNQSGSETNKIEIKEDDFVKAPYSHYGDWPAPEEFIFN